MLVDVGVATYALEAHVQHQRTTRRVANDGAAHGNQLADESGLDLTHGRDGLKVDDARADGALRAIARCRALSALLVQELEVEGEIERSECDEWLRE